ncbi:flagellar hook-associated protein 3 [Chromatiales bacterium (ex Bugula neritina AB1)]|nr:flagellar hook-associated protein 3 [Chromatiales bacterium (ex Bugula neritina AB1)]
MRISSNYFSRNLPAQMSEMKSRIAISQEQIASGKQFLSPSDNPSASGSMILMQQTEGKLEQYERNAQFAESRLTLEESALGRASNALISIREIVLRAANDTNGAEDREVMLLELTEQKKYLMSLANSVDGQGQFLFAGGAVTERPYVDVGTIDYVGDQTVQSVRIGIERDIRINTPGSSVFEYDAGGGPQDLFATIEGLEGILAAGASGPGDAVFQASMSDTLKELDTAHKHIISVRSDSGSRLKTIDDARQNNELVINRVKAEVADVIDLDYAEAVSRMQSEITSLEAIQATYAKLQNMSLFNHI